MTRETLCRARALIADPSRYRADGYPALGEDGEMVGYNSQHAYSFTLEGAINAAAPDHNAPPEVWAALERVIPRNRPDFGPSGTYGFCRHASHEEVMVVLSCAIAEAAAEESRSAIQRAATHLCGALGIEVLCTCGATS